jgi:putative esterase
MEPWGFDLVGRFEEHTIVSEALRGNPLGDSNERPLWVYVPPDYDDDPDARFAAVYVIQGLTGQLDMWRNRSPFRRNFPELTDELFARGEAPPVVVVWVDCWTSLGGSQFLDSPGTGNYLTYLCDEVVPFVDLGYRTIADREHRGIQGKSSGGYGAMVVPMLRPDLWGGLATHAGDALFEVCYLPEFRESVRALRDDYDGSFDNFWESFRSRPALSKESDGSLLNDWCMAACYSTDPDGAVRLPYDPATGELIPEVWDRWREKGRVLPGPRGRGLPSRARGDRRDRRLLRAVRCHAHGNRVPLPAEPQIPRGTPRDVMCVRSGASGAVGLGSAHAALRVLR